MLPLLIVISAGLAGLLGLGWLIVGPALYGGWFHKKESALLIQEIPLILIAGLILNYGLVLCFQSLTASLIISGGAGILGLACYGVATIRSHSQFQSSSKALWVGVVFVCLIYLAPIVAQPLLTWDARTIWFFHAKMIYYAGSFSQATGWAHPSASWSHVDYPNLVPVLAAQAAYLRGFWNEYFPKVSLLFMWIPATLWLFTFARPSVSFAVLLMYYPFSLSEWIWNGYMDGYLAFYFLIALMLFGKYLVSSQVIDLISSIGCLVMLLYLKNEGVLALAAGLSAFLSLGVIKYRSQPFQLRALIDKHWRFWLAGMVCVSPFMLWNIYKQVWGLSNDLEIGTMQSFARLTDRLSDGSLLLILQESIEQSPGLLLLFGFLLAVAIVHKHKLPIAIAPALIAGSLYFIGLIMIYLMTPHDLAWHLETSIDRTMLLVNSGLCAGSFFMLRVLEEHTVILND